MAKDGIELTSAEDLNKTIERTADNRADYTRSYLNRKGVSLDAFVEDLKKEPWNISIAADDNKSWALGIVELQKKLGFKQEDNAKGCDGRLGPYTWKKYQEALVGQKAQTEIAHLYEELKPVSKVEPVPEPGVPITEGDEEVPQTDVPAPKEGVAAPEVREEKVPLAETIFIGDSLTAGMAAAKSIKDAKECFKGGMQTGWMLKNFRERFFDGGAGGYKLKPEYQNGAVKKIVIEGGLNDITSLKSVDSVKKNLTEIYKLARDAGLTVVACTYPDWDAVKGVEIFKRNFAKHGWGEYPLSPQELQKRTAELNGWILAQNDPANGFVAVDLYPEMQDREKYPRADFVHPNGKGSKAMAAYIKAQGGILEV